MTHRHGVRCGEMVWVGGQVDLTPDGKAGARAPPPLLVRKERAHPVEVDSEVFIHGGPL